MRHPSRYFPLLALCLLPQCSVLLSAVEPRPNVLVIITDQQHAGMMSCTENPYVKTPNLDNLAAQGIRFERAYSANPVCIPSRFSMMTGAMPSVIGMEHHSQASNPVSTELRETSLGAVFHAAGYRTVYAGKTHLPGQDGVLDNPKAYGFHERLAPDDIDGRDPVVEACVQFLKQPQVKPFILYTNLINPHDICYLAIREHLKRVGQKGYSPAFPAMVELERALQMPPGMSEAEFVEKMCPPLPANYAVPAAELTAPWSDKPDFMRYTRREWGEKEWRLHRWAYARLVERVDGQIGRILGALREAGLDKNTVIVFTSDHGDQDGAHRVEHKAFLYEESVRIPFVVALPGVTKPGLVDRSHLVSSGLDLLPTVCDYAGIPVPARIKGASVRKLAEGLTVAKWRDDLVIENTRSRLVATTRWKYMVGDSRVTQGDKDAGGNQAGAVHEVLIDLQNDPGELNNLAADAKSRPMLEEGRRRLRAWYATHDLELDPAYVAGGSNN